MDDDRDRDRELAELQRRVYGPARDLDRDPAALARLRELTSGTRPARSIEPPSAEPMAPAPSPSSSTAPGRAAPRRSTRAQVASLWAGSVLVAVVATAATTAWAVDEDRRTVTVLALHEPPRDRAPVTLDVTNAPEAEEEPYLVADFHGMTAMRMPEVISQPGPDSECLLVGPTDAHGTASGSVFCGIGSIPASAPLVVTDDMPEELIAAFPVGSTLVFDLEGDRVRVRDVSR